MPSWWIFGSFTTEDRKKLTAALVQSDANAEKLDALVLASIASAKALVTLLAEVRAIRAVLEASDDAALLDATRKLRADRLKLQAAIDQAENPKP